MCRVEVEEPVLASWHQGSDFKEKLISLQKCQIIDCFSFVQLLSRIGSEWETILAFFSHCINLLVYFIYYFLPPRDNEMSEKENIYNKSLKFLDFFINIVYLFYLHLIYIYIVITIYIYNNIIKYYVMYKKKSIEHQFSVSSSKYNQHSSVWPINRSYSSALYWTVGFNLSLIIVTIKSL